MFLLGCGQQYRPVVSAINPVGPAAQPTKYAVAASSPSATGAGLVTVVDFAGDTVLATPQILPLGATPNAPANPNTFALYDGANAYAVNSLNSLSEVPLSTLNTLLTSSVVQTALPTNPPANPPSVSAFTFGGTARLLIPEAGRDSVAVLNATTPALQQEIGGLPATPTYVVGVDTTPRAYVLSAPSTTTAGSATAIEATTLNASATIPLGVNPVYGLETADTRRAFVVNQGSGTVSVINVTNNALDTANPTIPATGTLGVNPIWADLVTVSNELVVLNAGNGTTPGTLSVIQIPLCNALAQPTNPSCDPSNPSDGVNFGTVIATVPVGVNPTMVSVLADGTRAYVVNEGVVNTSNPALNTGGSLSVVDLTSFTVTATIPAAVPANGNANLTPTCPDGSLLTCLYGNPNTVAATTGTPTGKVYITSPFSNYMTVLETDTDTVDTHVNLQGAGVRVRVTAQ